MALYDEVRDLPLTIEGYNLEFRRRNCAGDFARMSVLLELQDSAPGEPGFTRPSTTICLMGDGDSGYGEDVTYDIEDHRSLIESRTELPLTGSYTLHSFSEALEDLDLFPDGEPARDASLNYRRWAFESAALDLALKQAGTDLASVLEREYQPVRFLASTRLGDPPTIDRLEAWLDINPNLEFKLDATSAWSEDLIEQVAATDVVRTIDFKGKYVGTMVDQPGDPVLYRRILEAFPETIIEDPVLTDETTPLFGGHQHRISWDAMITDVQSIESLSRQPNWINIKPSRSGSIQTLFEIIEYCLENDITMYGGGQTELGVGRQQLQAIASLFYPESPNDIAPRRYNDPIPVADLPTSPLAPPAEPIGFEWSESD